MVQALPQYNEQMEKLSLHVEVGLYLPEFSTSNLGGINEWIMFMRIRKKGNMRGGRMYRDNF